LYHYDYNEFLIASWIMNALEEHMPLLSDAESSIMTGVAVNDFHNYLKTKKGLIGEFGSDFKLKKILDKVIRERPWEIRNIINDWIEPWIIKWRQRVKIVWDRDESLAEGEKLFLSTEDIWNNFSKKDFLKEFIIGSLIRIGEYCFTNLVAESILRKEISKYMRYMRDGSMLLDFLERNPLTLLNDAIRDVSFIKNFKGQTVVMKVDKKLFKMPVKRVAERPKRDKSWIKRWRFFNIFYQ